MNKIEIEFDQPVSNTFPDLSEFKVLVRSDGRFALAAGLLCDGLIVPLFHSDAAALQILEDLPTEDPRFNSVPRKLGDTFLAMRKAACDGAAGFQLVLNMSEKTSNLSEDECQKIVAQTEGRVLFPFMVRFEEAGSLWPTILGSAGKCDSGCYLTRQGPRQFGPLELMQWIRWDILDHASAELGKEQPLRSHDPGKNFFALPFNKDGLVFFAKDHILKEYAPPEGYIPIFTSAESAEDFLTQIRGGAFHILERLSDKEACHCPMHGFIHALDLPKGSSLITSVVDVENLPDYISYIRDYFGLPCWSKFVINPYGHREDSAWGFVRDAEPSGLILKSVSGRWHLNDRHEYALHSYVDWFTGEDTFYRGTLDFRFCHLGRSCGTAPPLINGHRLADLSDLELHEAIVEYLQAANFEDEPNEIDEYPFPPRPQDRLSLWMLIFWDVVTGNKSRAEVSSPFDLARLINSLELQDREARVSGARLPGCVGFEGSGNRELEDSRGKALQQALVKICARIARQGYCPQDSLDMVRAANNTFELFRITTCGVTADLLLSFVESEIHPAETIYEELGIDQELRRQMELQMASKLDPEAEALLTSRVGKKMSDNLLPRTKLFLSTALLQFKDSGHSQCLDYAPISVEIVKGLEHEIRQVFRDLFPTTMGQPNSNEREILEFIVEDKYIPLSKLIKVLYNSQHAQGGTMRQFCKNVCSSGLSALLTANLRDFMLEEVLNRFRNGGAHEHQITFATCQECIDKLIGDEANPGLIFVIARRRDLRGPCGFATQDV